MTGNQQTLVLDDAPHTSYRRQEKWRTKFLEQPSLKYTPIEAPSPVILAQASKEAKPTLPRKVLRREWCSKAREKNPLSSSLTGPGRAGKYGELVGQDGGRYTGEVLAGHPHGLGQYYIPLRGGSTEYMLKYDGEWVQGLKNGQGTQYYASGEVYAGDFRNGARHGYGRLEYLNGDVYEGEWEQDRRNGRGRYLYASGDIFEGTFLQDRREGLGVLLRLTKVCLTSFVNSASASYLATYCVHRALGLKHVCEYVNNKPKCGTVLKLESSDLAPLTSNIRDTILSVTEQLTDDQLTEMRSAKAHLPAIDLSQPNKVLLKQAQEGSGTYNDSQLEMLRHAYVLMCSGDSERVGLLSSQLKELAVMADLDLSEESTAEADAHGTYRDRRIHFDDFVRVIGHYKRGGLLLGDSDLLLVDSFPDNEFRAPEGYEEDDECDSDAGFALDPVPEDSPLAEQ